MDRVTLTWVDGHLSCAHRDRLTNALHGHTWRVRAYWKSEREGPKDAVIMQSQLREMLKVWDHTELPAHLQSAEEIASAVKHLVGCHRVDVWREPEGMGASVE